MPASASPVSTVAVLTPHSSEMSLIFNPAKMRSSTTVASDGSTSEGGGAAPITGYTLVSADSMEAAIALSAGCPILGAGGSIQVCETFEVM